MAGTVVQNRVADRLLGQRPKPQLCFPLSFQYIPLPVLYGVFLYMGVASLNGIQVRLSPWVL